MSRTVQTGASIVESFPTAYDQTGVASVLTPVTKSWCTPDDANYATSGSITTFTGALQTNGGYAIAAVAPSEAGDYRICAKATDATGRTVYLRSDIITVTATGIPAVNATEIGGTAQSSGVDVAGQTGAAFSVSQFQATGATSDTTANDVFVPTSNSLINSRQAWNTRATTNFYLWYNGTFWVISASPGALVGHYWISTQALTYSPAGLNFAPNVGSGASGTILMSNALAAATDTTGNALASATAVAAIPTNPLLTSDTRLPSTTIAAQADVASVATAVTNAANFTGQFPASVLGNAPTGPTYNLTGVTAIGDLVPLPLVLQQYCNVNLTIPLAAAIAGTDTVKFAVTSMADRTTILWEYTATVNAGGLSVTVTADDTNTGILPPAGWYWYLVDTTTKLRIGEGPLALEPGPLVS